MTPTRVPSVRARSTGRGSPCPGRCRPQGSGSGPLGLTTPFRRLTPNLLALALGWLALTGCGGEGALQGEGQVLVRMTEWQLSWFEEQVGRFAKDNQVQLAIESYQGVGDLESELRTAAESGRLPLLCKVEHRMIPVLREAGLLRPLDEVVDSGDLEADLDEYLPSALEPLRHGGKTWGLPRKVECMVLLYRRSAIREAVLAASMDQQAFVAAASRHGFTVPPDHQLEYSPQDWDLVDLFQVAHYLARVPSGGRTGPRFWHRTAPREGVSVDLACLAYPFGYEAVPLDQMPGFPRFLLLERFAHQEGIFPPFREEALVYTPEINQAWSRGEMDLALVQQVDATRIVGSSPEAQRFLEDRSDAGFAPLPAAGGFAAADDLPRVSPAGGWSWCLPAGGPAPALAYRLARFLTSREVHLEECRRFGMMPIRRDLAEDLHATFPDRVLRELMEVSSRTWEGRRPKPSLVAGKETGPAYRRWREVVGGP